MSNEIPESLRKFEGELERAIKRRLELASARRRRARPRILAGTTLALAGLAAALTLVFTAASSPPAFAVTRNHDGTVSVKIMRLSGLPEANARLAAMQIHVKLVQVKAHCGRPVRLPAPPHQVLQTRIKPWKIARGHTLVLGVQRAHRTLRLAKGRAVVGPVPACVPPVPLPCLLHKGRFTHLPPPMAPVPNNHPRQRQLPAPPCAKALRAVPAPSH